MRKLKNILFLSSIFIITVAFNFQHNPPSNWYQQFLTIPGSQQINDMTFLDSLTGFIVTSRNVNPDTATIFKTTNGGDNWNVVYNQSNRRFSRIMFINNNTGFASGGTGTGTPHLYKTTNAGINWNLLPISTGNAFWNDMYVLNEDTIWVVDQNSLNGGVYRTTNGGLNWENQYSTGIQNPNRIYFFNSRIGFFSTPGNRFYKTTNSGVNWSMILSNDNIIDIYFTDSLTGWKSSAYGMKKTTDGGLNWTVQFLPPTHITGILRFSNVNKDTIWGVGGAVLFPGNRLRSILYRTTDGGNNWAYQIPDTSIALGYEYIKFVNRNYGWAYAPISVGIHTKSGGDTTFLTKIFSDGSTTPKQFYLYQNYPNPFNPTTYISYELKSASVITLKVFDLQGKEVTTLINEKQNTGSYTIRFEADKYNLSSGIYFYTLQTNNFKETKKMMLVK